jgi:hypothetical protein
MPSPSDTAFERASTTGLGLYFCSLDLTSVCATVRSGPANLIPVHLARCIPAACARTQTWLATAAGAGLKVQLRGHRLALSAGTLFRFAMRFGCARRLLGYSCAFSDIRSATQGTDNPSPACATGRPSA